MAYNNTAEKEKTTGSSKRPTGASGNTKRQKSGAAARTASAKPKTAKSGTSSNKSAPVKNTVREAPAPRVRRAPVHRVPDPVRVEIQDILIVLILVVLNLCMFLHSHMGLLGRAVYGAGIGLFGFSAFLLCLFSLVSTIMLLAGVIEGKQAKLYAAFVLILMLSILLYLFNGDLAIKGAGNIYKVAESANGGAFGGVIAVWMAKAFGRTGAIIILIVLMLIPLVIITEKPFTRAVAYLTGRAVAGARYRVQDVRRTREEQRRLIEEKRHQDDMAMSGMYQDLKRKKLNVSVPEQKVFGYTAVGEGLYQGEEVLNFAFYDDSEDFYLAKKRAHQSADGKEKSRDRKEAQPKKTARARKPAAEKPASRPDASMETWMETSGVEDLLAESPLTEEASKVFIREEPKINLFSEEEKPAEKLRENTDGQLSFDASGEAEEVSELDFPEQVPVFAEKKKPSAAAASGGKAKAPAADTEEEISMEEVAEELDLSGRPSLQEYRFPSIELLHPASGEESGESRADLLRNARTLEESLASFGVEAKVLQVNKGPAVTRYELQPSEGVRVSRIMNLADDIALNMATSGIRIEGPIPGKKALGIEVPNKETTSVNLREVIDSDKFRNLSSPLAFALGKDIDGNVQVTDIAKMPHLLIAGATGSGKSVCINCLLMSILYKAKPDDVGLILIDPKVVELSVYNGIPHLLSPVVTDPKKAALSLNWAVQEMTKRYKQFSDAQVRDIKGFNEWVEANPDCGQPRMKRIIIVVDELADLMMVASKDVEDSICRLAQMARAAGIHLVIATQRPSVDVITGLIKANIPSRLAFAVSSGVDSRTILDMVGAEKLLGRGDMLFAPIGASKPIRIQGAFVSDHEVEEVVAAVRQPVTASDPDLEDVMRSGGSSSGGSFGEEDDLDEFLEQAIQYVVDKQKASISMLQRVFRIGFNRAARLMDALEDRGIVGPDEGSKPRKVLMTSEQLRMDQDDDEEE